MCTARLMAVMMREKRASGEMAISPSFSANYAILQLCRVAANHVAQFSNGSCRFGPATSAMKTSAIISVITRLPSLGRSCRSSARLGLGSGSSTRPVGFCTSSQLNPNNTNAEPQTKETQLAAARIGLDLDAALGAQSWNCYFEDTSSRTELLSETILLACF